MYGAVRKSYRQIIFGYQQPTLSLIHVACVLISCCKINLKTNVKLTEKKILHWLVIINLESNVLVNPVLDKWGFSSINN